MRLFAIVFACALLFLAPKPAAADSLETVSIGLGALGGPSFLTPFDHTLGTLQSVQVSILGAVTATIATTFDAAPIPIPVPFSVGVDQTFFGIPGNAFFSFLQPATFVFSGTGSGLGELQTLTQPFDYEFTFNAFANLVGQTSVGFSGPLIPPGIAFGNFAGFTDTFSPLLQEFELIEPSTTYPSVGGTLVSWSNQGAITVQYDYVPAGAPMDEPSTLLLLGAGFLGLAAGAARLRFSHSAAS